MKLSIIIVNYNVKYFIEQCLHSVYKAIKNIEAEVYVIDNNSVDGSCALISEKFPQVILIENKQNTGFSKANNQGIELSKGEYVLLLNPDTVVQEDTFLKCIAFMDARPQAGALGIKMIDGKGNFLPESKRSLPTPMVAFWKIFGMSSLFPKSKLFGKYHLSYLNDNENHEVEILAGAYMFMRRDALNKIGLLDETFFMYGEDIDLSYRFIKGGYKNYYFADSTIIHYKGESTKKGSLNYVLIFYNAMVIFARKHFSTGNARMYSLLINLAIFFRASLSIVKQFTKRISQPLTDWAIVFAGFTFLVNWWETIKYGAENKYPKELLMWAIPVYSFVILLGLLFANAYQKPIKIPNIIKGSLIGGALILIAYALLPLDYRFSRAVILLGILWSAASLSILRLLLHLSGIKAFRIGDYLRKRIILIGEEEECLRVTQLLHQTHINPEIVGQVRPNNSNANNCIGQLYQLEDIVHIYNIDELIFCARDLNTHEIIDQMMSLSHIDIEYKIAPPESLSVIGSNSINTAGDLYLIHLNSISRKSNKRTKRNLDVITAFLLLLLSPILAIFPKNKALIWRNLFDVLLGKKTWIGYYNNINVTTSDLPPIAKGIFSPIDGLSRKDISDNLKSQLNYLYAKDYKYTNDIRIILKNIRLIGSNN